MRSFCDTAVPGGVKPGVTVKLSFLHNEHVAQVGITAVSGDSATSESEAFRRMTNHRLPRQQWMDLVFIGTVDISDSFEDLSFPYMFRTEMTRFWLLWVISE